MAEPDVVEEKPTDEQWRDLCDEFGRPRKIRKTWNLSGLNPARGHSHSAGEAMVLIKDAEGQVAYVSRKDCENDWFLPMGRIMLEESIAAAAAREAREETGLSIRIESVPVVYLVDIHFAEWRLVRWHFLVRAKALTGGIHPIDSAEIDKAGFFSEAPFNRSAYMRRWLASILRLS